MSNDEFSIEEQMKDIFERMFNGSYGETEPIAEEDRVEAEEKLDVDMEFRNLAKEQLKLWKKGFNLLKDRVKEIEFENVFDDFVNSLYDGVDEFRAEFDDCCVNRCCEQVERCCERVDRCCESDFDYDEKLLRFEEDQDRVHNFNEKLSRVEDKLKNVVYKLYKDGVSLGEKAAEKIKLEVNNIKEKVEEYSDLETELEKVHILASSPSDGLLLSSFAMSEYPEVRLVVAESEWTPSTVLANFLSKDVDPKVRAAVAARKLSEHSVYSELANDEDDMVVAVVASNPNTPFTVLRDIHSRGGLYTFIVENNPAYNND